MEKDKNLPAVKSHLFEEKDLTQHLIDPDKLPEGVTKKELQEMLRSDLETNLKGVVPRLPQIKIDHQGTSFVFPPDEHGESETRKTFKAIIMHHQKINALWKGRGLNQPPDCSSKNGITGNKYGGNDHVCSKCEFNQFGTAVDQHGEQMPGKACKNMQRLHLLFPTHRLPWRLTMPPTSLVSISEFLSILTDKGLPYTMFFVTFNLEKITGNFNYSKVNLNIDRGDQLPAIDYLAVRKLKDEILSSITEQEISAEEYEDVPSGKVDDLEAPIPPEDRDPDIEEDE